jgi:hypothetical protein
MLANTALDLACQTSIKRLQVHQVFDTSKLRVQMQQRQQRLRTVLAPTSI